MGFGDREDRIIVPAVSAADDTGFDPGEGLVLDGGKVVGRDLELGSEDGVVVLQVDGVLEEGAESDVVAGGAEYILEFHEEIDDVLLVKVGDAGPDRFGNHVPDCFDFLRGVGSRRDRGDHAALGLGGRHVVIVAGVFYGGYNVVAVNLPGVVVEVGEGCVEAARPVGGDEGGHQVLDLGPGETVRE